MARHSDLLLRLQSVEYGARNINLYRFVAVDGQPLPPAEPGAHIDVEIDEHFRRSYSLINSSVNPEDYVIAVLADERGRGGSKVWHAGSVVGNIYKIAPPRNNFALPDLDRAHLFAGGIGITPIVNMYRHLKREGKAARLFYWARSEHDVLFASEFAGDPDVTVFISGGDGKATPRIGALVAEAPREAHLFCCGPSRMLDEYETASRARPSAMVHRERFTGVEKPAGENGFSVRFAKRGLAIDVAPGETILEACLKAGIDLDYSCEEGTCGACEVKFVSGSIEHRDHFRSPEEHEKLKTIMICCSLATGPELVLDV